MFSQEPNHTTAPTLTIGILAIGSLYWDPKKDPSKPDAEGIREAWWRTRLEKRNAILVHVPIRYGRLSSKRANTYTMVFFAGPAQHGSARVIPCQKPVANCSDLIEEAKYLWAAERAQPNPDDSVSAKWGGVSLLLKDQTDCERRVHLSRLRDSWIQFIRKISRTAREYDELAISGACVTRDGLLQIAWPTLTDASALELDLLLATTNRPTLLGDPLDYPDVDAIADAWRRASSENNRHQGEDYFWKNKEFGITTFQDSLIEQALGNQGKLRKGRLC